MPACPPPLPLIGRFRPKQDSRFSSKQTYNAASCSKNAPVCRSVNKCSISKTQFYMTGDRVFIDRLLDSHEA